ncbi:hypothetical protein [Cecembia rubra]|uniref:Uncharacterized protein n=1 Tax=Cecembia rubra TaxID=1485585 RepID=A0A2P8E0S8_9BACT|nr:hypothetical protein [Cecembia rubra]PSL03086.1 hypothetical protein CLV48_108196 [Cecembia rubra]
MKNQIKNLLRAGVFMLAAVLAFAFTKPVDALQPKYAVDSQGRLYDLTGVNQGSGVNEYQCILSENTCTWADIDLTTPMQTEAQFVPGSGLQPIGE